MEEKKGIKAKAVVRFATAFGKASFTAFNIQEGTILDGLYYPKTTEYGAPFCFFDIFVFDYEGKKDVLYIGHNGKLVSLGEGQEHKYMMLDRLLQDCKYFLWMSPSVRSLYFPNIARHMFEMRQYWKELNIKPEWLSYKQIGKLEHKMNQLLTRENRKCKKQLKY